MESKRHEWRSVRSAYEALARAGASGRWSAPNARTLLSSRALAQWALQIAVFVFFGSIVLALLWWFNQGRDA
jgi:hypothetical protein